jgi:hypothetical protein
MADGDDAELAAALDGDAAGAGLFGFLGVKLRDRLGRFRIDAVEFLTRPRAAGVWKSPMMETVALLGQ